MGLGKFLDPKNDYAFKQIFGTEKNLDAYEQELKRKRDERAVYEQQILESEQKGFVKGKAEGKTEGKAEGLAEGAKNAKLQIAKQLLERGNSIGAIQTITGLLPEEIGVLAEVLK